MTGLVEGQTVLHQGLNRPWHSICVSMCGHVALGKRTYGVVALFWSACRRRTVRLAQSVCKLHPFWASLPEAHPDSGWQARLCPSGWPDIWTPLWSPCNAVLLHPASMQRWDHLILSVSPAIWLALHPATDRWGWRSRGCRTYLLARNSNWRLKYWTIENLFMRKYKLPIQISAHNSCWVQKS